MKNKEWSAEELKTKLEAYCAASEHCETEARMRLRQLNCDPATEDIIIDHLIADNFISDERYAKAFVHDKLLYQGWGRVKIAYMLRGKKIDYNIVQSALQTIDETEYIRVLSHLISQRLPQKTDSSQAVDTSSPSLATSSPSLDTSSQPLSKSELDSLYRFLTQRGFTLDEIKSTLNEINSTLTTPGSLR